jgi:hypothetical protein
MTHDWILDVLSDLKSFARKNDLPILAEQLGDTQLIAMSELKSADAGVSWAVTHERSAGDFDRSFGPRQNA